jgi:epoxyqueuosine reductase
MEPAWERTPHGEIMPMPALDQNIEQQLRHNGADLVGFADISGLSAEKTGGLPRAISIGVALGPAVVQEIRNGPTPRYFAEYERLNRLLGELAERVAGVIRDAGGRAEPGNATGDHFDPATLSMRLQHKTVATRAGLGWVGRSALLVTRDFGPAVRLASVLTDADLDVGSPVDTSGCGDCRRCVDHCPAHAIVGAAWYAGAERDSICDAQACKTTAKRLSAEQDIPAIICGVCIHVCPWTQRYLQRGA